MEEFNKLQLLWHECPTILKFLKVRLFANNRELADWIGIDFSTMVRAMEEKGRTNALTKRKIITFINDNEVYIRDYLAELRKEGK